MLIQCNFLDHATRANLSLPCVVHKLADPQQAGGPQKVPSDKDIGALSSTSSRSRLSLWYWIKMGGQGRNVSSVSLFKRSVIAIFSGVTLCSLLGGGTFLGLLYFGRVDSAERDTAGSLAPSIQDVQAMHDERHGVIAMTRFLQQQVNRRQAVAHWWQLLAESAVLLHGIEWQGNDIEFTVSGRFSEINELITRAKSLNGSVNMVLREFRPDRAAQQNDSIRGVAQLKMTLCDAPRQAVSSSSDTSSVVGAPKISPSHVTSLMRATSSTGDCAPWEALSLNDVSINEEGINKTPLNEASGNPKEVFTEGALYE